VSLTAGLGGNQTDGIAALRYLASVLGDRYLARVGALAAVQEEEIIMSQGQETMTTPGQLGRRTSSTSRDPS
jgi:hypothetical protein